MTLDNLKKMMLAFKKINIFRNKAIIIYVFFTICSVFILFKFVNLSPRVDENFFFSSNDPQFQDEKHISQLFKRKDGELIIISAQGQVESADYAKQIQAMSQEISSLPGIISVLSLTSGPSSLRDALESPLWKRLLFSQDKNMTNMIVVINKRQLKTAVRSIEQRVKKTDNASFRLRISGAPYIVQLIQRSLIRDFKIFTLLAFMIFGIIIFLIFRSFTILIGALISCLNATIWTLILIDLLHIQIGLLTANLATIIFVLTLEHIVFLTFNWKNLQPTKSGPKSVQEAIRHTFAPSFWSMATTYLGFLSLLLVPARPLSELGISGALGTLISMGSAYFIYPAFLNIATRHKMQRDILGEIEHNTYSKLKEKKKHIVFSFLCLAIISLLGLSIIKHDPSLLSYFKPGSEISKGLSYIDRNGGSSPLIIVVRAQSGERLNTTEAYRRLWKLQESLEKHDAVGTVLSLPVLMAESKRYPLSFLLTWDWLLEIMESPKYSEISRSFITDDRRYGLFLLRMKELGRKAPRLEIIRQLKAIVQNSGFEPKQVGGIYALQGHMSKLIASSLIYGLASLSLIFLLINVFISHSLLVGMAMTISISIIPITVLGIIGLARVPLDIIAAPAINVAFGIGIDSMIHMVKYWQVVKRTNGAKEEIWEKVRSHFWGPVINAMLIFVLGFGIFLLSQFPPTQRFGGIIVLGVFLSAFISLFLMPEIAARLMKIKMGPAAILLRKMVRHN